jgi:hypothetical protein
VKLKLLQIGFFLASQTPALLLAQSDEGDSTPEISISIEDGKVNIAVNLNEPFRWENTRYESLKKFPQPWVGFPDIPHEIWFNEKGDMTWRQTDMMFMVGYEVIGNSAKNILNQYTAKYGELGTRTWSVDSEGNLKSFNENTGKYEIYTPEAFAKKFGLEFHQSDKYEIEAEVLGYAKNIKGVFDLETNLLNFDKLDYVPFFQDPKLIIEQSKDLKNWSRVKLSEPLPKEYQWPHELSIELNSELKNNTFYRVKIEED